MKNTQLNAFNDQISNSTNSHFKLFIEFPSKQFPENFSKIKLYLNIPYKDFIKALKYLLK